MAYLPIENHAMIGDMHTVALVGGEGTIDWLCIPRFDSPAVFSKILDDDKGGHFSIKPLQNDVTFKQFYWPDTNVLVTRFLTSDGAAELVDFMPVGHVSPDGVKRRRVIRRITAMRGHIDLRMECFPAFDFGRADHDIRIAPTGAVFASPDLDLGLSTKTPLRQEGNGVVAEFTLEEGQSASFILRERPLGAGIAPFLTEDETEHQFRQTVTYWRRWLSRTSYAGRWREMVYRSLLALKLMTYEPTGAIVASPTCSLPEGIGGERNWDYRYTWIRDSAFVIYAFLRLGFTDEAKNFMEFLNGLVVDENENGPLQIMYGIDGRRTLTEETLNHLDGYKGSKPVRVGNAAYDQLQLDIYGELMDAIYLYNKHGAPIGYRTWQLARRVVDWVCENWQRKDEGVWEVRGGRQHFVYSKLMCWVAVDRGLRLADKRSFPCDRARWQKARDAIYEDIMQKGWDEERKAFVQHYGSKSLDAANLTMPLVFFLSPVDPMTLQTLEATLEPPDKGGLVANSLVYRYNADETDDGLSGEEGTFNICTFWLVEALARAGQYDRPKLDEARLIFERMLGFANHVGLYAEETGHHGEGLGNFPQAFTHLAVISAAFNLDRALGTRSPV